MKVRCLLVDDEPPAIEVLRSHISATPMLEIAGECNHAMGAFDFLQRHHVDLLFLDVQMPMLLGTDFIRTITRPPRVIFTTAHSEYAVEGFDLNAVDFLLKPISFDRFLKAIQKVLHPDQPPPRPDLQNSQDTRFLYFRADRKMVKVLVDDIRYVESLKDYVKIFSGEQPLITKQTIMALEEMLPADGFLRVHRSFIVAVQQITSYTANSVFIGKAEIPVGPLYRHEVTRRLSVTH